MTVFRNVINRIFRSKLQVIIIIILPLIFMYPTTLSVNSERNSIGIGVVDKDNTDFTRMLKDRLGSKGKIKEVAESNFEEKLLNSEAGYVIVIEKGFTNSLIKGDAVEIKGYYLKESIASLPIQNFVQSFVSSSKIIAQAADGDENSFYKGMELYADGPVSMEYKAVAEIDRAKSYTSLGLFVMFMMFTSAFFTTLILTDKENGTFYRTISAPVSIRSYMLQNTLGFMTVSIIQVTVVMIQLKIFLGVYMGNSILNMYLLFMAVSLVCISLGIAICSFTKSLMQAVFAGMLITLPMSFLGGCWWKNEISTDLIRHIGRFTPVYWIMESVNKLLNEQSLYDISGEISIILLFAMVFLFFGTWRKADVAK